MRKGQNVELPGLVLVAIFITSGFIAILMTPQAIQQEYEFNSGDYNEIAEATLKADLYTPKIQAELNYSSNIVALNQAEDNYWENGRIPGFETTLYEGYFLGNVSEAVKSQNRVAGCEGPRLEPVTSLDSMDSPRSFSVNVVNPFIVCESESATANISVDTNNGRISSFNQNNTFYNLSKAGFTAAEGVRVYLNDYMTSLEFLDEDGDGMSERNPPAAWEAGYYPRSEGHTVCAPDKKDSDEREKEAKDDAEKYPVAELVRDALDEEGPSSYPPLNTELADFISVSADTEFKWDFTEARTRTLPNSCDYNAGSCDVPEPLWLDHQENGTEIPDTPTSDADCDVSLSDCHSSSDAEWDRSGDEWTVECDNTDEYFYTRRAEARVNGINTSFTLSDSSGRRLVNEEGELERLEYKFSYFNDEPWQ